MFFLLAFVPAFSLAVGRWVEVPSDEGPTSAVPDDGDRSPTCSRAQQGMLPPSSPVATPCSKRARTVEPGEGAEQPNPTPPKSLRIGFGGVTSKAAQCKNDACGAPRTKDFKNALCPDCEYGFRRPGRSRAVSTWTEEMKRQVADESKARRDTSSSNAKYNS